MDRVAKLLEALSNAYGPTGFEGPVRDIVRHELEPITDGMETDGLGSIIAKLGRKTKTPRVMLAAHMDEVGLLVKHITPEGYLRFQLLGGLLDYAVINQRWVVLTRNGPVPGVTGLKSPHTIPMDKRNTAMFKWQEMFVDVGATSREDAEERLSIRPGDPIAADSKFMPFAGGKHYLGKAWDDRVGVAAMVEVMRNLASKPSPNAVYGVGTVQEEVGLRGAQTASYQVKPDIGINLESGIAADHPGFTPEEAQEALGKGPGIFLHDGSMLPNLKLRDFVVDVANDIGIAVQFEVLSGYGEDGAEMQRSYSGVPTINISVPTRYLHGHNSVISRSDFDQTVTLVTEIVRRLDAETVEKLRNFD